MQTAVVILLDGLAYGMVLFIISVGLTVTMGLMRVVNLAHGAYAMAGGYVAAVLVGAGMPFFAALVAGTAAAGFISTYSGSRSRGGNASVSTSYGAPISSSAQSTRRERAAPDAKTFSFMTPPRAPAPARTGTHQHTRVTAQFARAPVCVLGR